MILWKRSNPTRTCVTVIDRQAGTVTELVEEHAAIVGGGERAKCWGS